MKEDINVSFSDLTYTKQGIASLAFPFGISLVASYAKKNLGIKPEIFKYPEDFSEYLEKTTPKIACFSSYAWNNNLAYNFAKRIKSKHPRTVLVFGGPNYPLQKEEQKKYLASYPAIDFYVWGEGEKAFASLFRTLEDNFFDTKKILQKDIRIPNTTYLLNGDIIEGEVMPRIKNLDEIPSPYKSGLLDKFFNSILTPLIQTTRGCPFTCAYCHEGNDYFNEITRLSPQRVKEDLEYIAERADTPNLLIVDANFGMYKEDLITAETIAEIRKRFSWPKFIEAATGKNKSERVIECATKMGGQIHLCASVQSTDPGVLKNIRRNNISFEEMIKITKSELGSNSLGEVILGLPGDTKEAHIKSNTDIIDLDVNQVRNYQFILLPRSELSSKENREKFRMQTRFRVLPMCFGNYTAYGEKFPSAELDEICVSNDTLSYEDYLECRKFDLSTELAYNSGIFRELINFLKINNVRPSEFIAEMADSLPKRMENVYRDFLKETKESIWESKEELQKFLQKPEIVAKGDLTNEFRINEIYSFKALVFFKKMKDLHEIIFSESKKFVNTPERENYLNELYEFSLAKKDNLLADKTEIKKFHFDFVGLEKDSFLSDPFRFQSLEGVDIEIGHSREQREIISKYVSQYGDSIDGLGRILHKNAVNTFYRKIRNIP